MKRALLHDTEPGRVCEVKNVGEEFEVAPGFSWIDCPDEVTTSHSYNSETGEFTGWNPLADAYFVANGYKLARQIAYKSVGEQLDMLYKEVTANGTISQDGAWAQHITSVKSTIPKDDPAAVMAWNQWWSQQPNNQP